MVCAREADQYDPNAGKGTFGKEYNPPYIKYVCQLPILKSGKSRILAKISCFFTDTKCKWVKSLTFSKNQFCIVFLTIKTPTAFVVSKNKKLKNTFLL